MADILDHEDAVTPVPVPLSPRAERVVDGSAVGFSWQPVEGVRAYRIQVALDRAFEHMVFDEEFEDRTSVNIANVFPQDGRTFFWRVLAVTPEGVMPSEHVESFIAATRDMALQTGSMPGQTTEDMGPIPGLFGEAGREAGGELMGLDDAEAGVEKDHIESGQIIGLAVGVLIALVVLAVIIFQWTGQRTSQARLAAAGSSGYPALRENRFAAQRLLSQYEPVDAAKGVYRIPIDQAMDRVVQEYGNRPVNEFSAELPLSAGN